MRKDKVQMRMGLIRMQKDVIPLLVVVVIQDMPKV